MQDMSSVEKTETTPQLQDLIAERAYFIAESQDFAPGREFDNWLAAETEILAKFMNLVGDSAETGAEAAPAKRKRATTTKKAKAASTTAAKPAEAEVAPARRKSTRTRKAPVD